MLFSTIAYAQAQAAEVAKPSIIEQFMPFIFIFVIFWFFIIRPQQKRAKTHQNFLSEMKKGDSVLTSSGILGTIEGLTDKFITLEIADGVRVRMLRSQVASKANEESS